MGAVSALAPSPRSREFLQHWEVLANLLNTKAISVPPPYRWCLEGVCFVFFFLFCLFQSCICPRAQTAGEFAVCVSGFGVFEYIWRQLSTVILKSLLPPCSLSDTAKHETTELHSQRLLPAFLHGWDFYSDITLRCDWQFIKPQKLEVEKTVRSPAPFSCQGGICRRCFCSKTNRKKCCASGGCH